ncbi:signal recognition particle-docking protein FtsY [Demequina sp. SYSU T00192]|uniref:Signal recognition particle receptor FtsY n=1 Tax=Demequina litoralis TaxID=3051660 RepID=A0ABT8GAL1_9MICO|nr:signal recognition particle-docking protein FtsY [Demequina sp. SYSU T00192]MDN4475729.1 signal recognition particle-docking protein FtsY [Demequina sp. SYSU T00192]
MDISWIPGDSDLLVTIVAGLVVIGGVAAALVGKGRQAPPREAPPRRDDAAATAAPTVEEAPEEAVETAEAVETPEAVDHRFGRLRRRVGTTFGQSLLAIFRRGALSQDDWDELEETLLMADVGAATTDELLADLKARLKAEPDGDPRALLRAALLDVVDPSLDRSLALGAPGDGELHSAVVVGVNGVGKTTTVGKLARVLVAEDRTVVLGAADTFRAAAADQLETWGARVGVPVVRAHVDGADPASVAYEAADRARTDEAEVLLVDTAGRLQNKQGLMDELGKIVRVVSKVSPPQEVLLVLDATTGQNGLTQARVFGQVAPLTGVVLTKLDGTAKGGIVLAVQRELGVPVKFVGLGEGADDLAPFDPAGFVDSLLGE